jgi:hypothetical protein
VSVTFHFINKVLHAWQDSGDGEPETRERVKWSGLQKAVLGEIGKRGDGWHVGLLGGLPQEAIFFQVPQIPLEKWEDVGLSLFKGIY